MNLVIYMTKIAVISDIHGNYHAIDLFYKDAQKRGVTKVVCLGDLASKYFKNADTVDYAMNISDYIVKGNIEHHLKDAKTDTFVDLRQVLGEERVELLTNLPYEQEITISGSVIDFFHAAPMGLDAKMKAKGYDEFAHFEAMFNPFVTFEQQGQRYKDAGVVIPDDQVRNLFVDRDATNGVCTRRISLVGHSHQEYMGTLDGNRLKVIEGFEHIATPDAEMIINVGSIGDPSEVIIQDNKYAGIKMRDYISYVILEGDLNSLEPEDIKIEMVRVPYIETIKAIYIDAKKHEGSLEYNPNTVKRLNEAINEFDKSVGSK